VSGLLGAVQFLTRVPVRTKTAVPHDRVVPWMPLVGALIGASIGGIAVGLGRLVPPAVAAMGAIAVGLLITGAFHEDGLADTADAFGGGASRERRLEILKDSRHGTYGVAALCTSIVLRWVSAATIASSAALFAGFVASHALGRTAAVGAMTIVPPAAEAGLGADHARRLRAVPTALGVLAGLAVVVLVGGWWSAVMVGAALVAAAATAWLAVRKIGGLVGDVLGAIEQVVECIVLVVVSGLAERHVVWWA
jgi:adenosylcobinamide-GDP ribazoletransferase